MNLRNLTFGVLLIDLWVLMLLLGSLVLETLMIYPNIFYNAPERFGIALQFMSVTGPAQYFRPFGMATVLFGVVAVIVSRPFPSVRWWVLASVAMIACEGIVSMNYFWPRNTILFVEGAAVHPVEVLRQTAREFQSWHWSRVAFNAASAGLIFVGFLRFYRYILVAK